MDTGPTRAEIAAEMAKVKPGQRPDTKLLKSGRNIVRRLNVKNKLTKEQFAMIESDLPSYPEWEVEVDD